MADRRIHIEILGVKGSTYINTNLAMYHKCIVTEFEDNSAFRMPSLPCISTECVEQYKEPSVMTHRGAWFPTLGVILRNRKPKQYRQNMHSVKTKILI